MKKSLLPCLFALLALSACTEKKDVAEPDPGYGYFPVDIGRVWIYDVDSIAYDNNSSNTTIDTFHFQYKEVVVSEFTDAEGKPARKTERFFRKNDTMDWVMANSGLLQRDAFTAQRVWENNRYVSLIFPPKANQDWNGNAYNAKGEENYTYSAVHEPYTVNGTTYPSTVQVLQVEDLNQIEEIRRMEVYAKDIGLVYLQSDSINTQNKKPPAVGTVSRGYRYKLMLKSHTP